VPLLPVADANAIHKFVNFGTNNSYCKVLQKSLIFFAIFHCNILIGLANAKNPKK